MYLSSIRCNFVEFALARSRGYGVHKAHATAVAACTERTHGQLHSDAKRKATNCTNAWGLCGNVFALEIKSHAR